jgi:hypothetical protein
MIDICARLYMYGRPKYVRKKQRRAAEKPVVASRDTFRDLFQMYDHGYRSPLIGEWSLHFPKDGRPTAGRTARATAQATARAAARQDARGVAQSWIYRLQDRRRSPRRTSALSLPGTASVLPALPSGANTAITGVINLALPIAPNIPITDPANLALSSTDKWPFHAPSKLSRSSKCRPP